MNVLCYCACLFFLMNVQCLCNEGLNVQERDSEIGEWSEKEMALENTQKYIRKCCVNKMPGNACDYF